MLPIVVTTALRALERFDKEHAGVNFHIVYNHLREPLKQAVEEWIMKLEAHGLAKLPPVPQELMDRLAVAYEQKGELKGSTSFSSTPIVLALVAIPFRKLRNVNKTAFRVPYKARSASAAAAIAAHCNSIPFAGVAVALAAE
jgi:hypothetical protein